MKKAGFWTIWIVIIVVPVITILRNTPMSLVTSSPYKLAVFLQSGLGLIVFSLLFIQIILGTFMDKITKFMGTKIVKFHIINGTFTYFLAFLHPVIYLISIYLAGGRPDPYMAFVNACLICKTPRSYFLSMGIISFWFLTTAFLAAILRKLNPWFKKNWKYLHVLNYIAFILIGVHGFFLGKYFKLEPFFVLSIILYTVIVLLLIFFELPKKLNCLKIG